MTDPEVRPEVLALLAGDIQVHGRHPSTWTHQDGQPLSSDEYDLAVTISDDELSACIDQLRRTSEQRIAENEEHILAAEARIQIRGNFNRIDREKMLIGALHIAQLDDEAEIWARISELTKSYFDRMPPGTTLDEVRTMLTRAEGIELEALINASPEEAGGLVPRGDTGMMDIARHVAASFAATDQPAVTATRLLTEICEIHARVETLTRDTRPPLTTEYTNFVDNQGRRIEVHLSEVTEPKKAMNATMTALAEGAQEHALALHAAFWGVGEDDDEDSDH